MKNRWKLIMAMALGLAVGCGAMDVESPPPEAPSPTEAASEEEVDEAEVSEQRGKADVGEPTPKVEDDAKSHSVESTGELHEDSSEPPPEAESVDHSCGVACFAALWCRDSEPPELGACIDQCEDDAEVDRPAWKCAGMAEGCEEVGQCDEEVQVCEMLCGIREDCGHFVTRQDCLGWCTDEFWKGRLDDEVRSCMADAAEEGRCHDMEGCSQPSVGGD